jgi:hypothetical protein
MLGALASMSGDDTFLSPYHFTAVQSSATQLDLSGGFPQIKDVTQIGAILQHSTAGVVTVYFPSIAIFGWDAVNDRITVTGATFAVTDVFQVIIRGADRATDLASDARNVLLKNHYQLRGDSAGVPLLPGGAQALTASWVDIGPEIPMFGFNRLKLWNTLDINLSNDARLRVLEKHASGGSEEYDPVIETVSASDTKVESDYWEFNVDADALNTLVFKCDGLTPYLQVQGQVGTLGGTPADIDALYYTRGVFGG